jgi:hypothetical protein
MAQNRYYFCDCCIVSERNMSFDVVNGTVQFVIRRLPNSLCSIGRIHPRTHGCKWSLLKVRERKYKREQGEVQVDSKDRKSVFLFPSCFKNLHYLWEGRNHVISIQ